MFKVGALTQWYDVISKSNPFQIHPSCQIP